ncbi:OmpA family protein [Paracrocinitomix mangrovi]|uniref:OmpA family protein n=1 Tax=Paracrocinitomix mangrovi TaxID=2862509 RepID=UPI001C8E8F89|nr:OmpA family protein [Paracrocinitomix mangrovi]UKN01385.1 OmpA family protein [Paracrocinitomix mangrovi]
MRYLLLHTILFLTTVSFSQRHSLEGVWQGLSATQMQSNKQGTATWMEFNIDYKSGDFTGFSRYEIPYKEYYAFKKLKGTATSDSTLKFEEYVVEKKEESSFYVWCLNKGELKYNAQNGYLEGTYESTDCRQRGRFILYRSRYEISKTDTNTLYHSWFDNFIGDLKRGWKAYYVRDAEMRNFEMLPVLFDHDKDSLKPEFHSYLDQMVKIVKSHSDLRIKIIGHTDSNGTDEYNVDLSQRRADTVKAYLVAAGLKPDRVVIEFRGESDPRTSNATAYGKSLNRRVDFEFI